jgi:hypothetical protein
MDLKETETRNDCAGEGLWQFSWLTDTESAATMRNCESRQVVRICVWNLRRCYQAAAGEDIQDYVCCRTVIYSVCRSVKLLIVTSSYEL